MELPVDLLHWSLASLPILALAILMVNLRWTAQQAGAAGIFIAAAVAFFIFETPMRTLAVAGAKGVWDSVSILLVIWPALLLYQIMNQAGGYEALRQGITRMSRNELFVIVALGWVEAFQGQALGDRVHPGGNVIIRQPGNGEEQYQQDSRDSEETSDIGLAVRKLPRP